MCVCVCVCVCVYIYIYFVVLFLLCDFWINIVNIQTKFVLPNEILTACYVMPCHIICSVMAYRITSCFLPNLLYCVLYCSKYDQCTEYRYVNPLL